MGMEGADKYREFGKRLAAFAAGRNADVKAAQKPFYKLAFLNWYANTYYGAGQSSTDLLVSYYQPEMQQGGVRLIGRNEYLPPASAVIADCYSAVSLAYDDIHYETTLHPAAPIASAVAVMARTRAVSGEEALKAFQVGLEVECRCARAIFGRGCGASAGWYVSGITGGLGAAAAVGYLLGLDEKQMETALGLAASRAAGLRSSHGAMSTYLVPAFAAEAGYTAANMAAHGISCKLDALTGREGLIQMLAPKADLERALQGLGTEYICEETECKRYPYGFIASAVISACEELSSYQAEHKKELKELSLEVSMVAARLASSPIPDNSFDAHTAIAYIAALVLLDAKMAYTPVPEELVISEPVRDMIERIHIKGVETLSNSQAVCHGVFTDGSEKEVRCDVSAEQKMDEYEIEEKCVGLLSSVIGEEAAGDKLKQFLSMEKLQEFSKLL